MRTLSDQEASALMAGGPTLSQVLLGGAVAGFTIFLGLPLAFLRGNRSLRLFLNALSVGVLLFLFVEIAYRVIEKVESALKLYFMRYRTLGEVSGLATLFVVGFSAALVGLVFLERRALLIPHQSEEGDGSKRRRMALLIAVGIGLHNFCEGLVIGQQFAAGTVALGTLLIVGFALHNATEGFGIVGPLAGEPVSVWFLGLLGLIGGGPTFLGTVLGVRGSSQWVEVLFLSLAAGAILYVIAELIQLGKGRATLLLTTGGLLIGFFLAFGSDLVIQRSMIQGTLAQSQEIPMKVGDYFFQPSEIHLRAGQPVRLVLANVGEMQHEIEVLGMEEELEEVIPWRGRTAVLLQPRFVGRYPFICDMPGHLMRGMRGLLIVE